MSAQGPYSPGHMGAMNFAIRNFLAAFPIETLRPGDTLLLNYPQLGSGHFPDFLVTQPCFWRSGLVGFGVNLVHHTDVGGSRLAARQSKASSTGQEGMRIPPIKIVEQVDFEGTDPQSESGLNSYFNYTRSCDYAAVKCLTDPYGPMNAGAHRFPGLLSQPPAAGRWRSPYNAANIPVEAVEAATPVIVERFEFIPDSCGRGKYRGGLGVRRDVRIPGESIKFTNLSERHRFPPFGVMGGTPVRVGRTVINPDTAGEYEIGGKASVDLSYGDVVSFRLAGAGGYGDPSERDPKLIEEDLRRGLVTEW